MRKIKWGVLGTAGIARGCTIPGMLLAENCELYAIAGRNPEKTQQFQEEFGFAKAYGSYEDLLQDPAVEAVYIPLPNELHYEWSIRALQAKKHVLCEKPLAPTEEMAAQMLRTAEENGVYLMEAFAYLHSPLMAAIRQELAQGSIGDVLYMESEFITSDYELQNIRMRRETYGGSLYDLGCYCTSQIIWMLGVPDRVCAAADFSQHDVDMLTTGLMTYADGRRACFTCGMTLATEKNHRIDRMQIHGTLGSLVCDARFNQEGALSYRLNIDGAETVKTVQTPHNYCLEVEQLGRCITDGETPHVSPAFTLANARTLDKLLACIGYGQ